MESAPVRGRGIAGLVGGLGGIKLKTYEIISFIDTDIQSYVDSMSSILSKTLSSSSSSSLSSSTTTTTTTTETEKTPTSYRYEQIMRCIDILKLYKPLPSECERLHIPDERLDMHQAKNVLLICGAALGVRFSAGEMKFLFDVKPRLEENYNQVVKVYNVMDTAIRKKIPFANDSSTNDDDTSTSDNNEDNLHFIKHANEYLKLMKGIQDLVKSKQEVLASIDMTQTIKVDKDQEERMGSKLPEWLSVLLEKYKKYMQTNDKPTLGKFSAFLSCCIVGQITNSVDELEALSLLLYASNDSVVHYDGKPTSLLSSQTYVSNRIFSFISSLSELKSYVKDHKSIENFSYFVKV